MWPRSPARPSETSIALARDAAQAMPSATRGAGISIARRTCAKRRPVERDRAAERLERQARVAERAADVEIVAGPRARAQQRRAGGQLAEDGDADRRAGRASCRRRSARSRARSASASRPRAKPARKASSARGRASASVKASGRAPHAARSLRLTASALWPSRSGATVERKWRPSTSMSVETASVMPGVGCEQRAVVADAERGAARRPREEALDELELAEVRPWWRPIIGAGSGAAAARRDPGNIRGRPATTDLQ